MGSAVSFVHRWVHHLFKVLLAPFSSLSPVWPLVFISLLTGLLMLWIYSRVSAQQDIRATKNKIRGNLLAVRLFQHDIGVVVRLQTAILRDTLTYLKHSLVPLVVIILPVLLILVQVNLYFGLEPLRPGAATILEARLKEQTSESFQAQLMTPAGLEIETPPVRTSGSVAWRIRGLEAGRYTVKVQIDGQSAEKEVLVGAGWQPVSPLRTSSLLEYFLYPSEPRLNSTGLIDSVRVTYDHLPVHVFGFEIHWLILFFVLSVLFSFALKGLFGVEL